MKKLLKNTRGESLISILVAIPLSAIILSFFFNIIGGLMDRYMESKAKTEVIQVEDYLRRNFHLAGQCASRLHSSTENFNANKAITGGGLDLAFVLDDNESVLRTGQDLLRYGLHINSFKFKMLNSGLNFQDDPALPQNKLQFGVLVMNSVSISANAKTPPKDRVVTSLVLSVNPTTGDIDRCFLGDSEFDLCGQIGGTKVTQPNGSVSCRALPSCGSQLVTGVDNNGNAICKTLPTLVGEYCPPNHTLVSNGNGDSVCKDLGVLIAAANNPPSNGGGGGPPPPSDPLCSPSMASPGDYVNVSGLTFFTCWGGLVASFSYNAVTHSMDYHPGPDAGRVSCSSGVMPDGFLGARCGKAWATTGIKP